MACLTYDLGEGFLVVCCVLIIVSDVEKMCTLSYLSLRFFPWGVTA